MSVVTEYLQGHGVPFEVLSHPKAFTSIDEARALGVEADEVVKTLVVDSRERHALVAIPGSRRLDMSLVRDALGDHHAHLADEAELQQEFPEIELGAFPPIGALVEAETIVDPEVMEHETVVFAAGTQTESVKVQTRDLFRGEPVRVVPLTKEPE